MREVDARPKLVTALVMVLCAALSRRIAFPLVLLAVMILASRWAEVPLRRFLLRWAPAFVAGLLLFGAHALLVPGAPLAHLPLFGWSLPVSREGAARGLLLASRVAGGMSVVVLLGATTQPHEMFRALRWLRIPASWLEVATLMGRYVSTLSQAASSIALAQRTRLGYVGAARSLQSVGVLAGAVVVRSAEQALRTHEAMLVRGYTGVPAAYPSPLDGRQRWATFLGAALPVALLVVFEGTGALP